MGLPTHPGDVFSQTGWFSRFASSRSPISILFGGKLMKKGLAGSVLLLAISLPAGGADAQVSRLPAHVQEHLAEIGPGWGGNIDGDGERTLAAFTPLLAAASKDGVSVTSDLAYGSDPRQRLDLYRPEGGTGLPIVVYIHGGAYVRGERNINEEAYANVATFFARNGMIGVNATYRLAPAAKWPAAAEDVRGIVTWLRENAASHGGDPDQIYLIGHSAGATHVATYAFRQSLHPPAGSGLAGIILMSGRYQLDPHPNDPNLANVHAYFGDDRSRYLDMSPIEHVADAPRIPTFIVVAEYDNPDLDTQGALLLAALCERDRRCPRFTRMEHYNHLAMVYQFNTADEAIGREILDFVHRGR